MVDGKFEFLKYWCFTFICGILCLFLTLYWQLDYGIISYRYFWHWKKNKRNIFIGDKYEKCMRQWSKSLTPKARVPGWNPQLNQGSCIWIPIAYKLTKKKKKKRKNQTFNKVMSGQVYISLSLWHPHPISKIWGEIL